MYITTRFNIGDNIYFHTDAPHSDYISNIHVIVYSTGGKNIIYTTLSGLQIDESCAYGSEIELLYRNDSNCYKG